MSGGCVSKLRCLTHVLCRERCASSFQRGSSSFVQAVVSIWRHIGKHWTWWAAAKVDLDLDLVRSFRHFPKTAGVVSKYVGGRICGCDFAVRKGLQPRQWKARTGGRL